MNRHLRSFLAVSCTLLAVGIGGILIWRIVEATRSVFNDDTTIADQAGNRNGEKEPPDNPSAIQDGVIRDATLKYLDPKTGRLILIVKARGGTIRGPVCTLKGVTMERRFGDRRGLLTACSQRGTYDRRTGSGTLVGKVVVRRIPQGAEKADITIRSESLSWNQAAERLTSNVRVELSWQDASGQRSFEASGIGMRADRWTQKIRFNREASITMSQSAIPGRLSLNGKPLLEEKDDSSSTEKQPAPAKIPIQTIVTCSGPAIFTYDTPGGHHLASFSENVKVAREEVKLHCDNLKIFMRAGPSKKANPPCLDLERSMAANCLPIPGSMAGLWAARCLGPRSLTRKPGLSSKSSGLIDRVTATGSVVLTSADGKARGGSLLYDHPARIMWLRGAGEEMAEINLPDEPDVLAQKFWFDVLTGDMGKAGREEVTITVPEFPN
jgi:hypothetical protein